MSLVRAACVDRLIPVLRAADQLCSSPDVRPDDANIVLHKVPYMTRLRLVEDQAKDLMYPASVAESLGIREIQACNSTGRAIQYLENGVGGEGHLPDGIVLDLDLGIESGYEIL